MVLKVKPQVSCWNFSCTSHSLRFRPTFPIVGRRSLFESLRYTSCELAVVECRRFGLEILVICVIVSDILLLPVSCLPRWISSTHRRRKKRNTTTRRLDAENIAVALGILSLYALELENVGPYIPWSVNVARTLKVLSHCARTRVDARCVSVVQGHPRSLILAPIERAYATSC